jgi:hypothetical protein
MGDDPTRIPKGYQNSKLPRPSFLESSPVSPRRSCIACPRPHRLDRAPGVEQPHRQQVTIRVEPVAEHKGAKTARGKPVGHLATLGVADHLGIRTAWKDFYSGTFLKAPLWLKDRQSRNVFAGFPLGLGTSPSHRRIVRIPRKSLLSPAAARGCFCACAI